MTGRAPVRLGFVGAGGFARFLADAAASLPAVEVAAVTDLDPAAAHRLADRHGARVLPRGADLVDDPGVDAVVVATPPADHATVTTDALEGGKHVFCEKPLALDETSAAAVLETAERTGRVLVVDHVLRYNPILRALQRLRGDLLGPVQRFCFENDASDEDLHDDHWFWDPAHSGGIFVEHGVHFFDAAAMLIGRPADTVQAMAANRPDGPVDLVTATCSHGEDVLATHTHSFTHAHRCERQLMRLDTGAAEVRVEGWIPVLATVDIWTDDVGAARAGSLPERKAELLQVDGFRLPPSADVTVAVDRDALPGPARGRGRPLDLPHHARIELTLGGHPAKQQVYAESVRAALTDLARCITDGGEPASGAREGAHAVAVAAAARRSAEAGRRTDVDPLDTTHPHLSPR